MLRRPLNFWKYLGRFEKARLLAGLLLAWFALLILVALLIGLVLLLVGAKHTGNLLTSAIGVLGLIGVLAFVSFGLLRPMLDAWRREKEAKP